MGTVSYHMSWLSTEPMNESRLTFLRQQMDTIKEPPETVEIDLWLESPGGDARVAYKLALMLRGAAHNFRVVVRDHARGAAMLLTFAADEIYMGRGAELGPLDGQMPNEGNLVGLVSARNIATAADDFAEAAVEIAVQGGVKLIAGTGLRREQALETMLRFSATFSEPLVRQLDPWRIHDAKQTLQAIKLYAERLMRANSVRFSKPDEIANMLIGQNYAHAISYDEARDRIGLPLRPFGEYEYHEAVEANYRMFERDGEAISFGGGIAKDT